ncbi:unnamed protein product [Amoebophrya sp. A120]|nr:unnamed protein product [Amoebophrya sp. A120]CAD7976049.1 unnamed protein product [Amoebophrya sp. A120]|eukprot:GSA120T00008643001.1
MQHPTAQSRQRIREGITTLTLFQASLLFEHKEYQRRPGNISEIQQMFDTPFPTANLARQMSHRYRFRHQIVDGNATLVKNWGHNKTACQLALANMQSSMDPQVYTQVVADFRKALGLFT